MKIYLVGGAVRDMLLGLPIRDKDWVVVGSTPKEMINAGYQQVGHSFPVFLHPKSHEEYALARTEYKSGLGYTGFTCYSAQDVTLENDLQRRDLTINALAQDISSKIIIDPYGGKVDLKNCLLRHVSPAFSEDPVRILRTARFAACYAHLGFSISSETMKLMSSMASKGELEQISPERVWKETKKALSTDNPHIYFQVLRECGALKVIFPELDYLFKTPLLSITSKLKVKQKKETNAGIYTLMNINAIAKLSSSISVRFAILCQNIGKNLCNNYYYLNSHFNQKNLGVKLVNRFCQRLRIPNKDCKLAKLVTEFYNLIYSFSDLTPEKIVELFNRLDVWNKPQRINQIALINKAKESIEYINSIKNDYYLNSYLIHEAWKVASSISVSTVIKAGFKGSEINKELTKLRVRSIENWKSSINKYITVNYEKLM